MLKLGEFVNVYSGFTSLKREKTEAKEIFESFLTNLWRKFSLGEGPSSRDIVQVIQKNRPSLRLNTSTFSEYCDQHY